MESGAGEDYPRENPGREALRKETSGHRGPRPPADRNPKVGLSRQRGLDPQRRNLQAGSDSPATEDTPGRGDLPMQRGPLCPGRKEPQSEPPGKEDPSPRSGDLQQRWRP